MKRRATSRRVKRTRRARKAHRTYRRKYRGGAAGLSDAFPVTTWGTWSSLPGSTLWGPGQSAPAPLANGGLYTGAHTNPLCETDMNRRPCMPNKMP